MLVFTSLILHLLPMATRDVPELVYTATYNINCHILCLYTILNMSAVECACIFHCDLCTFLIFMPYFFNKLQHAATLGSYF